MHGTRNERVGICYNRVGIIFFSGKSGSVWGSSRRLQVPYVIPRPETRRSSDPHIYWSTTTPLTRGANWRVSAATGRSSYSLATKPDAAPPQCLLFLKWYYLACFFNKFIVKSSQNNRKKSTISVLRYWQVSTKHNVLRWIKYFNPDVTIPYNVLCMYIMNCSSYVGAHTNVVRNLKR